MKPFGDPSQIPLGEPQPGVSFPGQPEGADSVDDVEPMTEQHMAFLQQLEEFKRLHMEPEAKEEEDVPPPPSPPKGKPVVLPPNWKTAKDAEGKMYYYHTVTRQTQWDPPNIDQGEPESGDQDDMDLDTPTQEEEEDTTSKPYYLHLTAQPSSSSSQFYSGDGSSSKKKITPAAAEAQSSEMSKRLKEAFRNKMSSWVVKCLDPFRKAECKLGRINNTEDFKHLARKLTHHILAKELKHCRHVEDLEVNENVKSKAKDFVKKYMAKFGPSYKRSGNSPNYD